MNLGETIQALEAKNITVAINLGQHTYCPIDSNCPLAVELRRLITDAGVTLPELLEGYQAITATDPVDYSLPGFDGNCTVGIAGNVMHLNFNDIIEDQLRRVIDRKLREVEEVELRIRNLGSSLYSSYLYEIARSRDNHTLPQLDFSNESLVRAGCLITSRDRSYVFIFPVEYKPEYIVRDGIRHKLSDEDIKELITKTHLEFAITADNKFLSAKLLDSEGSKFQHYHGDNTYDCWGAVELPSTWNRRLSSLHTLAVSFMRALATINCDSLLMREPFNMPHISSLLDNSTELGREGELEIPITRATTDQAEAPTWGGATRRRRWRTEEEQIDRTLTPEEEMVRRFGTGNPRAGGDMNLICALCGETSGRHFRDGAVCPRDRR